MTATVHAPSDALRDAVAGLFAGTSRPGPPRIGIELELIPYRVSGHAVVPIDELRTALDGLAHVCFEPGGQIELNPPPSPTVTGAWAQLARLSADIRARLATIGAATIATGVNPWHTVDDLGLQLRTPRYLAMDAHFERIGSAGRAFMRQTASTQICVGLAAGADGMSQWRAANLVAPVFAAMFASMPNPGSRTAVCKAADPSRTRHGDPPLTIESYTDFARRAEPLDAAHAGNDAVHAHLSTLFPPVRPRGQYLEFRALDALPLRRLRVAASLLACLLADPISTAVAADACAAADQNELWHHAAGAGIRISVVRDLALRLIDIVHTAIPRLPSGYLPPQTAEELAALRSTYKRGA